MDAAHPRGSCSPQRRGSARGALAAGPAPSRCADILAPAAGDPLPADAHVLVLVTLYGGNDGLNTVIPYADPAYHDARPDLAYAAGEVLQLDDRARAEPGDEGLHGSCRDGKQLAIVRGVGYPKPDRSHFRSMDIWQTGRPDHPANTGWLGRWLDATGGDPRRAVSLRAGAAAAAGRRDRRRRAAAGDRATRRRRRDRRRRDGARPAPTRPSRPPQARAAACYRRPGPRSPRSVRAGRRRRPGRRRGRATTRPRGTGGAQRAGQRSSRWSPSASRPACRPGSTRSQPRRLRHPRRREGHPGARLLGRARPAVAGFVDRMAKDRAGRKVVLAVYSEFGRRVPPTPPRAPTTAPPGRCSCSAPPVTRRLLRRPAQPDRPRRRRPQGHHRLPRRLRHAAGTRPGNGGGPGARRHPAHAGLPLTRG